MLILPVMVPPAKGSLFVIALFDDVIYPAPLVNWLLFVGMVGVPVRLEYAIVPSSEYVGLCPS